jgi:hypothetical protein
VVTTQEQAIGADLGHDLDAVVQARVDEELRAARRSSC